EEASGGGGGAAPPPALQAALARLALPLGEVEQHERPADGAELLVDHGACAALVAAPVEHRLPLLLAALAHTAVEDDLHALVARERPLDLLVELAAMPRHHQQVLGDGQLLGSALRVDPPRRAAALPTASRGPRARRDVEEAGERAPRAAAAGRARGVAELEALVAVEAEGELFEGEMDACRQHPWPGHHSGQDIHAAN